MEGEKQYHPLPVNGDGEFAKSVRDFPPAHYTLKIDAFSELVRLLAEAKVANYESNVFEASGYKWKLYLYPNGDKDRHGEGYISLYLVIQETDDLPPGWEVNVNFKLFVYDQINDKYLTIQDFDGKVRRFHKLRMEWGFAKLLPLATFKNASNGYLVRDKCVFGAEVFVISNSGRGESVSVLKGVDSIYTWKIDKFSSLDDKGHVSQVFTLKDRKWKMVLYPKGPPNMRNSEFSLYLYIDDLGVASPAEKVFTKFLLRVRDQKKGKHVEFTDVKDFSSESTGYGYTNFMPFAKLHDASKGFLVKDTLIIEAKIITIYTVEPLSNGRAEECVSIIPKETKNVYTWRLTSFRLFINDIVNVLKYLVSKATSGV